MNVSVVNLDFAIGKSRLNNSRESLKVMEPLFGNRGRLESDRHVN